MEASRRAGWRGLGGLDGGGSWMERWVNLTGTEPNRKKNRSEPHEPKPSQNPYQKPKRTETKRGTTAFAV